MSFAFLFHYLMLTMFRMLVHPSSGACDLFVELFHVLYCSGSMLVGVTVWFGWGNVVSGCRLKLVSLEFFIDIKSFRSHYGPGVDSTSNRNKYQEHFLGVKAAGA